MVLACLVSAADLGAAVARAACCLQETTASAITRVGKQGLLHTKQPSHLALRYARSSRTHSAWPPLPALHASMPAAADPSCPKLLLIRLLSHQVGVAAAGIEACSAGSGGQALCVRPRCFSRQTWQASRPRVVLRGRKSPRCGVPVPPVPQPSPFCCCMYQACMHIRDAACCCAAVSAAHCCNTLTHTAQSATQLHAATARCRQLMCRPASVNQRLHLH
jgi:hypothetical protein